MIRIAHVPPACQAISSKKVKNFPLPPKEQAAQPASASEEEDLPDFRQGVSLIEVEDGEEEILLMGDDAPVAKELPRHMLLQVEEEEEGPFSPAALQRYGFEALVGEIRRTVRQELENERGTVSREEADAGLSSREEFAFAAPAGKTFESLWDVPAPPPEAGEEENPFADLFAPPTPAEPLWEPPQPREEEPANLDGLFAQLFQAQEEGTPPEENKPWFASAPEEPEDTEPPAPEEPAQPEELPLVYEVTLEQLLAMTD